MTATQTKQTLIARLDRLWELTPRQYEDLVCDIGEYNARNPRSKLRVEKEP